jgi:hypothetical protein
MEPSVTETDRPVKIKIEFEIDPRDLVKILSEIDFGFDHEPGIREIRAAVKDIIVKVGISHLLYLAGRKTYRADQTSETTDPGARKERSEHLIWCRGLVNKAFKPRRPRRKKVTPTEGTSLFDLF